MHFVIKGLLTSKTEVLQTPSAIEVNLSQGVKYSFLFNTSHVVLRDMPNFFQKHVWFTGHDIPITQRPGWWNTATLLYLDKKYKVMIALRQQEKV